MELIKDLVQPLGVHNPVSSCVRTASVKHLVEYDFSHLNPMQTMACEYVDKDNNLVVVSPTASGKTVVIELFIGQAVEEGKKALCLFPLKALTEEKLNDWLSDKHSFSKYNIVPITGDYKMNDKKREELENSNLILATSEMLDSKTRNYNSNQWLSEIGTLIVDESHLVGSPSRGPKLESALMRFCHYKPDCKIVLLSATVPNKNDLVDWLNVLTNKKTVLIESDYRPCILNKRFVKFRDDVITNKKSYDKIEKIRMDACRSILNMNPQDQHLIFTGHKYWGYCFKNYLKQFDVEAEFHNADLPRKKRLEIENRFKNGDLKYLISTSTLAWGCHSHGSKILMGDGTEKNVEDVKEGDHVLSLDIEKNIFVSRKVLKSESFEEKRGYKILVKCLHGNYESTHVTVDHKFMSKEKDDDFDKNYDWKKAEDLQVEDFILMSSYVKDDLHNKTYYTYGDSIHKIEKTEGGKFQKIAVEEHENYICDGFVSHNCNLPARRVVLAHTSYGMTPMEVCDIEQACGRSGRPKYDKEGDAYIMVPASSFEDEVDRIKKGFEVKSSIHKISNLAFNVVSEITLGNIKNVDDFHSWYERSLAYIQNVKLNSSDYQMVFDLLEQKKMILKDGDGYIPTHLGKIASVMYMNPLDVYDWFINFLNVSKINPDFGGDPRDSTYINKQVSLALANCYEYSKNRPYISKSELNSENVEKFIRITNRKPDGVLKIASCYFAMLSGDEISDTLKAAVDGLKLDIERIISTVKLIHNRYAHKIAKHSKEEDIKGYRYSEDEWDSLFLRIKYGVPTELCNLVKIPGVGEVFARKLYSQNIKNVADFITKPEEVKSILGQNRYSTIMDKIKNGMEEEE